MSAPYSPSSFYPELYKKQYGLCAWCRKALSPKASRAGLTGVVDHNHRCCPAGRTCGNCVRGAVCQLCNVTEIRHADWAYENGLQLKEWQHEYISRGEMIDQRTVPLDDYIDVLLVPSTEDVYMAMEYERQTRLDFPLLTARFVDRLTEREIAEALGVHRNTVSNRVAKERDVFLTSFLASRGLRIEGDESAEELLDAYGYLKAAGR